MDIAHLVAFNLTLIAAILSPGPALLVALQTVLSSGKRAGIALGLGLALMASTWTLAALLGLEAVFRLFPWAYAVAKIAGAAYLLYIAWKMWAGAKAPIEATDRPRRRAFLQGVMVNALNPKSVLFAAAVLIVIFPPGMSLWQSGLVVLNHFIVEVAFYSLLSMVVSTPAVSRRYLKAKVHFDRVAAVVLGLLGLRLLLVR
jgi:Putative threonine efflux protein